MESSVISQVQDRISAGKNEGKVSFLAKNRFMMKIVFPSGETEEVVAGPRVRFGEFSVGSTVRVKAQDHFSALWSKVEPTTEDEEKKERVKRKHATFDMELLRSSKGLSVIATKFPKIKFKGPGYESADLRKLIECYKDWSSELYPKFTFHHVVRKLEMIGPSKDAKMYMSGMRLEHQVQKQDEAYQRELAQQQAQAAPTEEAEEAGEPEKNPSVGQLDDAARRRMEESRQRALAKKAQRQVAEDYEDVDRAIDDQLEIQEEQEEFG